MAVSQKSAARSRVKDIARSRREREKLQRRETIISAAKELFYENGYQTTTMEDIAAAAEVSKGTLYLYFDSKDELYISVVLEGFQIIDEKLAEITASDADLVEKGRSMFMAFVEFCLENPEYFRTTQYFLTETARQNLPAELVQRLSGLTTGLLGHVAALIADGQEKGLLNKDVEPQVFAVIAWRTATGLLDLALVNDTSGQVGVGDYRELFEQAFGLLSAGLMKQRGRTGRR